MKKSLLALAVMAASGCSMAARSRDYDDQARGHELRALDMGGLEASLKSVKCNAPAYMANDGRAVWLTDRAILGAGKLGTPAPADTIDFKIPGGTLLTELAFVLDDCDTGAAFVFGVGYRAADTGSSLATNATYFAAAGQTVGQAGGRLECSFKPIKFEEEVIIQLLVGTAPAGIAGNPEIHMVASGNSEGHK